VCREVLSNLADGRAKLWTTHRALQLRTREHALFRRGEYVALEVTGERQENVVAFLRRDTASERSVLAVIPRFACTLMRSKPELPLGEAWGKDQLRVPVSAGTRYTNVFTGEVVTVPEQQNLPLSTLLGSYPVGLFISEQE
jgi:(1->4)-alpha-D-glucan 1-alpha-D-glucosylmutase